MGVLAAASVPASVSGLTSAPSAPGGMSVLYVILSIVMILCCIAVMASILLQEKSSQGLGTIAGMGNTLMTETSYKGKSNEERLERYSKIGGAVLFIFSLIMVIVK